MTKAKPITIPAFKNESDEADWWAGSDGRKFVKQKSASRTKDLAGLAGSSLITNLNKSRSVQIALRLPETDLVEARRIAARKGVGYQTLLKMLLHEGLQRERLP